MLILFWKSLAGELVAVKVARPVRGGEVGKAAQFIVRCSLAFYPTEWEA